MSGILPKLGQYGTTLVSMFNPDNLVRGKRTVIKISRIQMQQQFNRIKCFPQTSPTPSSTSRHLTRQTSRSWAPTADGCSADTMISTVSLSATMTAKCYNSRETTLQLVSTLPSMPTSRRRTISCPLASKTSGSQRWAAPPSMGRSTLSRRPSLILLYRSTSAKLKRQSGT